MSTFQPSSPLTSEQFQRLLLALGLDPRFAGIAAAFVRVHPCRTGDLDLFGAAFAALMHALIPAMFEKTASRTVAALYARTHNRGR